MGSICSFIIFVFMFIKPEQMAAKGRSGGGGGGGYRSKSPWGAWVTYNDKRGGGIFYYNPGLSIF